MRHLNLFAHLNLAIYLADKAENGVTSNDAIDGHANGDKDKEVDFEHCDDDSQANDRKENQVIVFCTQDLVLVLLLHHLNI